MKTSYDYNDLIAELEKQISNNALVPEATIQIRRGDKLKRINLFGINDGEVNYCPIIAWYYDKSFMAELLKPEPTYDRDGGEKIPDAMMKYINDIPYLQDITIKECLNEMIKQSKKLHLKPIQNK